MLNVIEKIDNNLSLGTGLANCYVNGTVYEGHLNITYDGYQCIPWTVVRGTIINHSTNLLYVFVYIKWINVI